MSSQITEAFVQQYSNNVQMLSQQKGSLLRGVVDVESVVGKHAYFERIGAVSAQKRVSRHSDTPQIDTPHSRRRVSMADYEWADLIDQQDRVRTLIDPTSSYALLLLTQWVEVWMMKLSLLYLETHLVEKLVQQPLLYLLHKR